GTILDNDKPSVTGVEVGTDADADSVVEGNALNFNVTLSEATQSEVTYTLDLPVSADVDLSTVTFSAGVSYDAVTKLLTVEAGVTDFTITVPTVDDSIVEAAEDYIVTVDGVAATGTILDNDKPSVTGVEVGTDADADSVVEGNALNFNVTLSEATQSEVTYTLDLPVSADVDLSTVTFSAGVSYDAVTKLLTVEAGVTDFTITVPTVDDSIVEAAEDYIVTVDGVAATGTILDNDKPSVTGVEVGTDADADSVVEGNALNFNVTLSEATQSEVTYTLDLPVSADVDLSTVTFSAGVSYDAVTKLLTVEAGVTDFTITVPTVDDSIVEAAEDYIVTVDGVAATGTILDNDKPSVTGVEVGTDADADSVVEGNALNFNVTLSEATQSEVTYTLDLPVSADVDLSTVTFSAGVSYDAVTKLLTVEA
ncbi:Calx-beta domain-containing protein, partial [Vibrio splendidus]